jgi:hypothetical protein
MHWNRGCWAPASFQSGGRQYLAAIHAATEAFVSNRTIAGLPAAPATPGEILILYGIGFGPLQQGGVAGQIASGEVPLANPVGILIGGVNAAIAYAGHAPGLVGLYQFNVTVPANLPSGDQPVAVTLGGTPLTRQSLYLPVSTAANTGAFTLTSTAGVNGGVLPAEYNCDGQGATIPLAWRNSVPAAQVTGQMVTDAISGITLGTAVLNLSATRASNPTGSSANCLFIRKSTRASKSGTASVSCDADYAYVGSNGITTQPMMNGITSTNLQVPIPVNFNGSHGWKTPLNPAIATRPTNVVDGPIGVAINGVPIFNPRTQGG